MLTTFRWKQFKKITRPSIKKGMKNVYQGNSFCRKPRCCKGEEFESNGEFKFQWIEESRKRPKNNKKSTNKAFWSHFKHFGRSDCWEKFIFSSDKFGWGLKCAERVERLLTNTTNKLQTTNPLRHPELSFSQHTFLSRVPLDSLCCLTISSCVSVRMSRYWARGKFGEHERRVRVAPRATLASWLGEFSSYVINVFSW